MGTIPLFWGEQAAFGDALAGRGAPHWARHQLESRYVLRPLDTLSATDLAGLGLLLLAQPRALSGPENVALDDWVRAGGQVLIFADPLMTGESQFPIGDRRRPQDVILLSPILARWGLQLAFDEGQPDGVRLTAGEVPIPVNLAGHFRVADNCDLDPVGNLARCEIGQGRATVFADAALLDLHQPHPAAPVALDWLLTQGFDHGNLREAVSTR